MVKLLRPFFRFFKKREAKIEEKVQELSVFMTEEARLVKEKVEKRKIKQRRLKIILGSLVVLVIIFASIAFYSQYKLQTLTRDELSDSIPKEQQPRTGEEILQALSKLVLLPEGVPQIAEVQDVDKLKTTQAFFENALNGDIVVVYDSYIYLYRPSQNILVNYGEISSIR